MRGRSLARFLQIYSVYALNKVQYNNTMQYLVTLHM